MLVYTFVFRYLFNPHSAEVPYPIFFLTGIFAWHCFSIGTLNAASSVVEGAFLYKKAYFPKIAIPLGAIVSNTVNYLIVIPLLIVFILIGGVKLNMNIFYLPFGILLLFFWTTAVGLFLAILAPVFRDVIQLSEIFLQVWFFLTPILYPMSLPEQKLADTMGGWGLFLYKLNPMVGIIRFIQSIFLGLPMPGNTIIISCISTLVLLLISVTVFLRDQNTISERI